MNRTSVALLAIVCLLLAPFAASAQNNSIYSWTDENGVKHFSDKAPAEASAEVEQIALPDPDTATEADTDTLNNEVMEDGTADPAADSPATELSYADQQRQAMQEKRQAQSEKQAERQRICLQARDQLAQIEPSRRVFYTDDSGNTTRLDDEQRVQMVEESKKLVAQYCD